MIDSGDGRKLERYGPYILVRPDPQAIWTPALPEAEWSLADAVYIRTEGEGRWNFKKELPDAWEVRFRELAFSVRPTAFKHTGLFPEQAVNWLWFQEILRKRTKPQPQVLNLFAYTGGATLAAASSGAAVCHVDASKAAIRWARKNQEISGLNDRKIRWIHDDVTAFAGRELRRGRRYDGIIMDPPPYGRGPSGEMWKLEKNLALLMEKCMKLLSDSPAFFLINSYASGYSHHSLKNLLYGIASGFGGELESGDLLLAHSRSERLLPCGIFARWSAE